MSRLSFVVVGLEMIFGNPGRSKINKWSSSFLKKKITERGKKSEENNRARTRQEARRCRGWQKIETCFSSVVCWTILSTNIRPDLQNIKFDFWKI